MRCRVALIVLACGVAVFFAALYGAFGPMSLVLTLVGLGGIAAGLASFIFFLRASALCRPSISTLVLVMLGVALHAYEQTLSSDAFSVVGLLWALVPYGLCLATSVIPATRIPSITGATVVLLVDLSVHYGVFISPTSSTEALALVFAPLWSTLVFAPIAIFVTWAIVRGRRAARSA